MDCEIYNINLKGIKKLPGVYLEFDDGVLVESYIKRSRKNQKTIGDSVGKGASWVNQKLWGKRCLDKEFVNAVMAGIRTEFKEDVSKIFKQYGFTQHMPCVNR
jgi:hypothetical protein